MRRPLYLMLALATCLTLAGCRGGGAEEPVSPALSPEQSAAPYTQEDAYAAFRAWSEGQGIIGETPGGCVLAVDGYAGLRAVVIYTDEMNNTECNLSYVYADGTCSNIGVVSNRSDEARDFVLVNGGALAYLGQGRVELTAQEVETGYMYRYTVQCGEDGPGAEFTVETLALPSGE